MKKLKKQGFTLLEIVVSLAILALGILSIFSLIPTGVDQSKKGQDQSKAILLAQSKMESIMGYASENWENFYTLEHDHGTGREPYFLGPNDDMERKNWGWIQAGMESGGEAIWVPYVGFQWEWHFHPSTTPGDGNNLALITLTVSWPQLLSETTDTDILKDAHQSDNIENYATGNNDANLDIQFIRLVSYVSKGL